ncbi:MAG: hypothetical protein LBJ15_19680 [Comamonas sp.]|jgi:hypothetical protein|uniref:hypothetical protein n=1 Tax=Comamonas sp. TaxID=34028 RepID=UPI0028339691|nr:hypothetical protein [Comamonas sp.]MDR0216197.1 hypothetical protein [Comamonas sp.]
MGAIKRPLTDMVAVRAGNSTAFVVAVTAMANKLFAAAGSHIAFQATAVDVAREGDTPKAGLLAAALDLRELLAQSPDGRQALRDFGFKPLFEHVEGE